MKRTIKRYAVVTDTNNYWVSNSVYSHTKDDGKDFPKAHFTNNIDDATLMSQLAAEKIIQSLLSNGFATEPILSISDLKVAEIEVTFQINSK